VAANFDEQRLYPLLSDLIFHYRNLLAIRKEQANSQSAFPAKISKLDLQEFKVEYERIAEDPEYLEVILQILEFAIPRLEDEMRRGKELYDTVEDGLQIEPIGLVPLECDQGYLFLQASSNSEVRIYEYRITVFESHETAYRGIRTTYLKDFRPTLAKTFESCKLNLIRSFKHLPNPATWLITSRLDIPMEETLLPIAKRSLVRFLAMDRNNEAPQAGLA
jgi:hypothetical protein